MRLLSEIESVLPFGSSAGDIKRTSRRYDARSRLLCSSTRLNGHTAVRVLHSYDDLGRLKSTWYGDNSAILQVRGNSIWESCDYNLQGWLTAKVNSHLYQKLRYSNPEKGATPKYTGQISEIAWNRQVSLSFVLPPHLSDPSDPVAGVIPDLIPARNSANDQTYAYRYDALGRVLGADHFQRDSLTQQFTEQGIDYDRNGNILSLTRTNRSVPQSFVYEYEGARLQRITSPASEALAARNRIILPPLERDTNRVVKPIDPIDPIDPILPKPTPLPAFYPYPVVEAWASAAPNDALIPSRLSPNLYDVNGNMTYDSRTRLSLSYNELNLVKNIWQGANSLANYSYLADATKLSATDAAGNGLIYLGSLVYKKTGSSLRLESTPFPGGRLRLQSNNSLRTEYHLTDYLGSVRTVVAETDSLRTLVEQSDYLPFGLRWDTPDQVISDNRHRFNGKEDQSFLQVPLVDYGARMYDPFTGRWLTMDELAEMYFGINSYVFCASNPIRYIDINGKNLWINHRGINVLCLESELYNEDGSVYVGKVTDFMRKTIIALNAIRGTSTGASMISELESSENNFTIMKGDNQFRASNQNRAHGVQHQMENTVAYQLQGAASFQGGSGGTIYWDPNGTSLPTTDGMRNDPFVVLGHEMFHSLDANRGTMTDGEYMGLDSTEWQAVYQENVMRAQAGIPLRTHYDIAITPDGVRIGGAGVRMITSANLPILPPWYKP